MNMLVFFLHPGSRSGYTKNASLFSLGLHVDNVQSLKELEALVLNHLSLCLHIEHLRLWIGGAVANGIHLPNPHETQKTAKTPSPGNAYINGNTFAAGNLGQEINAKQLSQTYLRTALNMQQSQKEGYFFNNWLVFNTHCHFLITT